ncbi:MAG: CpsD/CapB family tyrosine-protein kinase [Gemmatimonadales bacterium]
MEIEHDRIDARLPPAAMAERLDVRRPGPEPKMHATLVAFHSPAGASAEAIRGLYYGLRRIQGGAPLGVLAVCSSARGEGRSTIAANLALIAARETGQPTAVVDCDLRAPRLADLFGIDGEVGLSDVLANRADLDAIVYEHHSAGIAIIPGGRPEPEPARRFMSPRFARFLAQIRHRFDEVVMDLPPLACADARILAPQCSGAVMIVRSGRTDASLVRDSLASIEGVKVLGAALNDVSESEAPVLRAARRALPGRR